MTTPLMVKGIYLMVSGRGYGFLLKDYRYRSVHQGYACSYGRKPWWFSEFSSSTERKPKWIGSDTLAEWNDEDPS